MIKGVSCGDIGPKLGYHCKNNGWCSFDNVRIPRDWMPMKYTSVDNEGAFSIEGDLRILYSTMMNIRVQLIVHSIEYLQRGLLISLRYSVVRRQFKNNVGNKEETRLLDYQTQQMKLLPLLSLSNVMWLTFVHIDTMYN